MAGGSSTAMVVADFCYNNKERVFNKPLWCTIGSMITLTLEEPLLHFGATCFSPSIEILRSWPIIVDCTTVGIQH